MKPVGFLLSALGLVAQVNCASAVDFQAQTTPDGKPYVLVSGEFLPDENLGRFEQLVATTHALNVTFNSPGGNVSTAMTLGRMIRKLDLGTIAVRQLECASACALAFLGGTTRYAEPGSIGVHRSSFSPDMKASTADAVAAVQQATGDIIQFIREMGVDPGLLQLALSYDSSDIRYLSGSEMQQYRVTTSPTAPGEIAPSASVVPVPSPRPDEGATAPTATESSTVPAATDQPSTRSDAWLLVLGPNGETRDATQGSVTWDGGAGQVRGQINVPTKLEATLSMRRAPVSKDFDGGQISVAFKVPYTFGPRGVTQLHGLWMRESRDGYLSLIGPARVSPGVMANSFDVVFSAKRNNPAAGMDLPSNLTALTRYQLLCLELELDATARAVLCLNKGEQGQSIFRDVVSAWGSSDPQPTEPAKPDNAKRPSSAEQTAIEFTAQCQRAWSQPNDVALAFLQTAYSDPVRFYGDMKPAWDVIVEKRKFAKRWPQRGYSMRADTIAARCDGSLCTVTSLVDWFAKSADRGKTASGVASLEVRIDISRRKIVSESGEVLKGQKPSVRVLVRRWNELNSLCRGGSGDSVDSCDQRTQVETILAAADWCNGGEGGTGAEGKWHPCAN